jgi:uncharacterized protein YecA (UPF0149 family)
MSYDPEYEKQLHKDLYEQIESVDRYCRKRKAGTQPIRKAKEPGRNDPCPCGSGKKYKHCHINDRS